MKHIFTGIIFITLLVALSHPAHAGRRQEVLGTATVASEINFPPVTAGPGFFLPDGPLFFLDKAFQSLRLAIEFDPLKRAQVHTDIAGERLAELRMMFQRNNEEGIDTTLRLLAKEMNQAAHNLSEAKAQGAEQEEVEKTAGQLNETLKRQRELLQALETETQDSLRLKVATARQQLREAKLEVEDSLSQAALEKEIQEDLKENIDKNLKQTENSIELLRLDLEKLNAQVEEAQIRNLTRREELLQNAINERERQLEESGEMIPEDVEENETEDVNIDEALDSAEEAQNQIDAIKRVIEEAQQLAEESQTFSQ